MTFCLAFVFGFDQFVVVFRSHVVFCRTCFSSLSLPLPSLLGESSAFFEVQNPKLFGRTSVKLAGTSVTKEDFIDAMWKSFRETTLRHFLALEKGVNSSRDGTQIPKPPVHLGGARRKSCGFERRERSRSKIKTSRRARRAWHVGSRESNGLENGHKYIREAYVISDSFFVFGGADNGKGDRKFIACGQRVVNKVNQTPLKASTPNALQRQSWFHLRAAADNDETASRRLFGDIGQECILEKYLHRIILMVMMYDVRV